MGLSNLLHSSSMSLTHYTARIERIRDLGPKVRELTLRLVEPGPTELRFLPGQSVAVEVPSSESQTTAIRYYSLASPPSQSTTLVLLLSLAEQETDSTHLFQQSEGTEVQLQGPNGSFCLNPDDGRSILFVATGTGIAPFRSMLYSLLEKPPIKPITLFWGLRSEHDLYYQDELQALANQHPGFSFVITLSRSQHTWPGPTGRVTDLVSNLPSVDDLAVYVCGHRKMVDEVTAIVRKKGHCPIYQEEY